MSLCLEKEAQNRRQQQGALRGRGNCSPPTTAGLHSLAWVMGRVPQFRVRGACKSYFKSTAGSVSFPRSRFPKASKHQPPLQHLSQKAPQLNLCSES